MTPPSPAHHATDPAAAARSPTRRRWTPDARCCQKRADQPFRCAPRDYPQCEPRDYPQCERSSARIIAEGISSAGGRGALAGLGRGGGPGGRISGLGVGLAARESGGHARDAGRARRGVPGREQAAGAAATNTRQRSGGSAAWQVVWWESGDEQPCACAGSRVSACTGAGVLGLSASVSAASAPAVKKP